jgi:hypothetical protein
MRFIIETPEQLVEHLEHLAQKARESIGKTRTKIESNEFKGQVMAFNEAIFYTKEFIKTQKEMEREKSTNSMGTVDDSSDRYLDTSSIPSDPAPTSKVKPA